MKTKIPKVIHYCWFGKNELGSKEKKCIESWKKYMPDYKIIRWDEKNYDISSCEFLKNAYEAKKWAFVSDYARLDIIYNYGGIYLDTDVEVIKKFDDLLNDDAFFGFESKKYIANGLGFGARKNNPIIKENLDMYNKLRFDENDLNSISCPKMTTDVLIRHGLVLNNKQQKLDYAIIYPKDFFCPKDYETGALKISDKTYSIHHYSMTWLSKRDIRWRHFQQKVSKIFGKKIALLLMILFKFPGSVVIKVKKMGIFRTFDFYFRKIIRRKNEKRKY